MPDNGRVSIACEGTPLSLYGDTKHLCWDLWCRDTMKVCARP